MRFWEENNIGIFCDYAKIYAAGPKKGDRKWKENLQLKKTVL